MARPALQAPACWDWNIVTMRARSPCRGQSQARSCSPCPRLGDLCGLLGAKFCCSNNKTKQSRLSFLLRRKTAASRLRCHLKDHQTTRFLATPVGNGGMKAQVSDAHLDLPEQGRTEGCIRKGHGGACVSFAGESLSWARWQEVSSPPQGFAGKCFS